MKKLLLIAFSFIFVSINYGQSASKNQEHCKVIESKKSVQHLNAIFEISSLNNPDQLELANFLYNENNYIYKVEFNQNNVHIHHIDALNVQFIENLLIQYNCFISLEDVREIQQISE